MTMKVLIIEDDRCVRELIKVMLEEKKGYEVIEVSEFREACVVARKKLYDGVIVSMGQVCIDIAGDNIFTEFSEINTAPLGFMGPKSPLPDEILSLGYSTLDFPFSSEKFCNWVESLCSSS